VLGERVFRQLVEGDSEEVEEMLQQLTDRIAGTQGDWEARGEARGEARAVEWLVDARFGAKAAEDVRRLLPNGHFTLAGIGPLILDSESSGELLAKVRRLPKARK